MQSIFVDDDDDPLARMQGKRRNSLGAAIADDNDAAFVPEQKKAGREQVIDVRAANAPYAEPPLSQSQVSGAAWAQPLPTVAVPENTMPTSGMGAGVAAAQPTTLTAVVDDYGNLLVAKAQGSVLMEGLRIPTETELQHLMTTGQIAYQPAEPMGEYEDAPVEVGINWGRVALMSVAAATIGAAGVVAWNRYQRNQAESRREYDARIAEAMGESEDDEE